MSNRAAKPLGESDLAKALAHPLRYRILNALEQRSASPSELAEEFGMPIGNVSYHVRQLAQIGLIKLVNTRQRRGAIEHYYRTEARLELSDESWGEVPDAVRGAWVQTSLTTIGDYVRNAAAQGGFSHEDAHLTRVSYALDDTARRQVAKELEKTLGRIQAIAEKAAARADAGEPGEGGGPPVTSVVLMAFEGGAPAGPKRKRRS